MTYIFENQRGERVRPARAFGTITAREDGGPIYEIDVYDPSPGTGLEYRVYAPAGNQYEGETHVRVVFGTKAMREVLTLPLTPCESDCDCGDAIGGRNGL